MSWAKEPKEGVALECDADSSQGGNDRDRGELTTRAGRPRRRVRDDVDTRGHFLLPTGTVTLVLGDVEGSTRAWETDPDAMTAAIARFNEIVDDAVGRHDGVRPVEQGEGDSFVADFARARDGVACVFAIQRELALTPLAVRIGVHTGDVLHRDEGNYAGPAVNRTARIRNLVHGDQTLLSQTTRDLVVDALPDGVSLRDLGVRRLKDLSRPTMTGRLGLPTCPVVRRCNFSPSEPGAAAPASN
jgi:class 3 adenylate cyclase